mmetsp:Transcript_7699/g.11929  ORF Transcript_7699/g.11929 Transcript_7699/m.11929 type:complete len:196 (+) Transcript_7699:26-613(+)|eukprot:CAMPEP_0202700664 /NCGR_PEP_ID=MMETSP1385-20130828/13844_1 /ASSEMBLY_ACC=CAM_ASM_000861 /TAXON_ID=933848 /ORGANISM="Elphidium margaritaceum" /LENGTH=195 /DNA_ID=CAMNT_0049357909 /DNA_START=25 /DNA_END=609 /DNA_ORIENTATION=-
MSAAEQKKNENESDKDIEYIKSKIGSHQDFPKKGVLFRDIFPVLRDPKGFEMIINRLCTFVLRTYGNTIDVIVGLDSRGFIFGPIMALRLQCSFVPIRKKGKLPGQCISENFEKEYGGDCLEIQQDSIKAGDKVIVVDDLLATGGTLQAAYNLLRDKQINADVQCAMLVIELNGLKGRQKLNEIGLKNIYSMIQY